MGNIRNRINIIFIVLFFLIICTMFSNCVQPGNAHLTVQSDKCIGCGLCAGACRVDAVRIIDGKAVIDPTKCVECGRCVEVCPVGSIY